MSGAANIDELIRRVEEAGVGSRELDGSVAWAVGNFDRYSLGLDTHVSLYRIDEDDRAEIHVIGPKGGRVIYTDDCPRYTTSLDAAMTLAEDADLSELLNEAMEEVGIRGWTSGDYRGALTRNFVASALRARALASKPAEGEGL